VLTVVVGYVYHLACGGTADDIRRRFKLVDHDVNLTHCRHRLKLRLTGLSTVQNANEHHALL
jgi:hypothetical protein